MQKGSRFSTFSPTFIVYRFFVDGHSDSCEVILHCGFKSELLKPTESQVQGDWTRDFPAFSNYVSVSLTPQVGIPE